VSFIHPQSSLPATEAGVPSATDKAGRFPFSAVSSAVLVVATGLGMVACGGGGGGGNTSPASVNLSGQAIKGPVIGGQVCAYTLSSPRQQIACATTDAQAGYKLALPPDTGEVLLEVTGGSYIDEATGQKVALTSPLRTVSKAGSADNALITPFTELAVQLASKGGTVVVGGGNLSLSGFQAQIGNLETGLGITGLATGNPFGGKSSADLTHQKALEAFSKQQASLGKDVGGTLQLIGSDLSKCGIASVGVSLAAYGAVGSTISKAGGGITLAAAPASATLSPDLSIMADNIMINTSLPSPCKDALVIDGVNLPLTDLKASPPPVAWQSAKAVEITQCTGTLSGTISFPAANLVVRMPNLDQIGNVSLTSLGNYSLAGGGTPINLTQSGISVNTSNGCLVAISKGVGASLGSFNGVTIVSSTTGSGAGGLPPGGTIGAGGNIIISGGGVGAGGGSIVVGAGGLMTTGSGSSGGGGITLGKSN
jgi:hypothetical protein